MQHLQQVHVNLRSKLLCASYILTQQRNLLVFIGFCRLNMETFYSENAKALVIHELLTEKTVIKSVSVIHLHSI